MTDSDGQPLSNQRIERARAGAGVDRDVIRLAIYDAIVGICSQSITKLLADRKPGRWCTDRQDCAFEIADRVMADWLGSAQSLTDVLEAHVQEIKSSYPNTTTVEERAKWRRLFAGLHPSTNHTLS